MKFQLFIFLTCFILFNLIGSVSAAANKSVKDTCAADESCKIEIYLEKNNLHVGILFRVTEFTQSLFQFLTEEDIGKYADIGWGDEDFYQSEDPGIFLALKAILIPTSSVVRIACFESEIKSVIIFSDFCIRITLTMEEFRKTAEFINSSFVRNNAGKLIETSRQLGGRIKFYRSSLSYNFLHTCNTWIGETLAYAGFKINPNSIITAGELFEYCAPLGTVLKSDE